MKISFLEYIEKLKNAEYHIYDIPSETCYFPMTDSEIDMIKISDSLNPYGEFLNHKESFQERKFTCERDEEWKQFIANLKKERGNKCEISSFNVQKAKELSNKIFGIPYNKVWINDWLVPHHLTAQDDYRSFDKKDIKILNRGIHMTLHRYKNLVKLLPELKYDYELWFELGCLIRDRESQYPWRNITESGFYKKNLGEAA